MRISKKTSVTQITIIRTLSIWAATKSKASLNIVIGKINEAVEWNTIEWSEEVVGGVKEKTGNGFISNGWCKMYQCLHQYPAIRHSNTNSLHLCEGPGVFIAALTHYFYSTIERMKEPFEIHNSL